MKTSSGYQIVRVGQIGQTKLSKAIKSHSLTLSADEVLGSDYELLLHPCNATKVLAAKKSKRGCRLAITDGEIQHDVDELQGGSFFSFLKKNIWPIAKTVLGGVGDAIAYSNPSLVPLREGVRGLTGVGMSRVKLVKGSSEAKQHMQALRSKRKGRLSGASFRLN